MDLKPLKIGIVGAGIAGCSAAYFLRESFGTDVNITLYEREERVGGRLYSINFAGLAIEVGAGLFHSSNRLLIRLLTRAGLKTNNDSSKHGGRPSGVGIWNGEELVVTFSGYGPVTVSKLLARYGFSLARIRSAANKAVARWEHVYNLQDQNRAFPTPRDLFQNLGVFELTQENSYSFLRKNNVSNRLISELFDGIARAIYNQDGSINAFAGMVALAGGGVSGGNVFAIQGGNVCLCEALARLAKVRVLNKTRITNLEVQRSASGFDSATLTDEAGCISKFDAVILAVPLETAQISISGIEGYPIGPSTIESQRVQITCIRGRLRPEIFRLPADVLPPQFILTTESSGSRWSTINRLAFLGHGTTNAVYKIQSREPLDDSLLNSLFTDRNETLTHLWNAYPILSPARSYPPFLLSPAVYYINAIESVVSTVETEIVASKNVVELVANTFRGSSKN
jgi:prenylcysteine oxidase/farnesylcysteine lyase